MSTNSTTMIKLLRLLGFAAKRPRRKPFKHRYALTEQQPIGEFEAKMVAGMFRERREVFVTAFCNDEDVLRVTASVGTFNRCRPADDPRRWAHHAGRVGATQIRQYHNHPPGKGAEKPSPQDRRAHRQLVGILEETACAAELKSLLVYPDRFGQAKIIQYDESDQPHRSSAADSRRARS
ncbi:MAG: JAB domain-containing protein, partial [Planctomycetota bacterium]